MSRNPGLFRLLQVFVVMTLAFALLPAQGKGPGSGRGPASGACLNLSSIPAQTLSEAESSWIILMREEEKLARDVYRGLFEKWGANVCKYRQAVPRLRGN